MEMYNAVHIQATEAVGKLDRTLLAADTGVPENSYRLFVTDKKTGLSFLVDTGANISVLPRIKGCITTPLPFKLYAANNTEISTYGEKTLELDLNLRRPYKWKFIVADVSKPILGADFLKHHQLVIDLKNKKLIDNVTNLKTNAAAVYAIDIPTVRSISTDNPYHAILAEYPGITRLTAMNLNDKICVQHYIETTGQPVHCRARPIPPHRYEKVKKEFENMIQQGLCRPSKSPWASPLHVVTKKNGDIRVCGDYRRLNAITKPDRYPVPRVKDFTYLLSGKTIFSTLDLNRAYQQVNVREEDIEKTAIITPMGLFEFPRMCPGMKNAGQTFQRYIHQVLSGLNYVFPFIDDLIIASVDETMHREHLRTVLQRLEDHGITINPSKCNFGQSEVKFLGYIVSKEGIKPPVDKVKVITEYPKPKTIEELRRFLGIINFYRDHIPNAALCQAPLNAYLHNVKKRDKTIIEWTEEALQAFEACKTSISNAVLIAHPSHEATYAIFCDASDKAAGAVLQQYIDKTWQPLGYFSKKFTDAQTRYSTYDRELQAMYMAIKHFRKMVEGRQLIIFTDHKPLTYAIQKKSSTTETPRRTRQLLFISEFTTDIRHVSGKQNIVADALSRIETINCPTTLNYEEIAKSQQTDPAIQQLQQQDNLSFKRIIIPNTDTELYCETSTSHARPYLPEIHRYEAFQSVHNLSHPGIRTTRKLIASKFFWPSMNSDIGKWAKSCIHCQKNKVQRHTVSNVVTFPPTERFQHVHVDIVGPLPTTQQGHRYLITMIDRHTKWPEAIPTDDITADIVAKTVYQHWITRFGCPTTLTSDQGRQFESQLFNNLMKIMGIKKNRTTPYHPQCNGVIERWHRSLKTALRAKLSSTSSWIDELPTVLYGLRAALRTDAGVSPAELTYGYNLRLPGDFFNTNTIPTPTMNYTFVEKLRATIEANKPQLSTVHHHNKHVFVHKDLRSCSHVFIRVDAVKKPLESPYEGPFKVLSRTDKVFTIQLPNRQANISIDRLKPAFHLEDTIQLPQEPTIPLPLPQEPRIPLPQITKPLPQKDTYDATPAPPPFPPKTDKSTRSGRAVKLPVRFT